MVPAVAIAVVGASVNRQSLVVRTDIASALFTTSKQSLKTMSNEAIPHVIKSLRLAQIPTLLRRAVGLPNVSQHQPLSPETRAYLQEQSRAVRGTPTKPAIFVHGVLPRCGSNFVGNTLALHPNVSAFPRQIYELPLMATADGSVSWYHEFLSRFPRNAEVIASQEPLAWLASGMMRALQAESGEQTMLFKCPSMHNIDLFDCIFPDDILVLVVRDGRDIIESSTRTFYSQLFAKKRRQLTIEWQQATDAALRVKDARKSRTVLWRYEDLVTNAEAMLRDDLPTMDLDPETFPFDELAKLPVFGSSRNDAQGQVDWQPAERQEGFQPVGRWQHWSKRQQDAFMRHAGSTMKKMGYV